MAATDYMNLPFKRQFLTDTFGRRWLEYKRPNGTWFRGWNTHTGIDFAQGLGAHVGAAGAGRVIEVGNPKYKTTLIGRYVVIQHDDGWVTRYHMLDTITVKAGQLVTRGQQVGTVGQSGSAATGYHLHFETLRNGVHYDPLAYLDNLPRVASSGATHIVQRKARRPMFILAKTVYPGQAAWRGDIYTDRGRHDVHGIQKWNLLTRLYNSTPDAMAEFNATEADMINAELRQGL